MGLGLGAPIVRRPAAAPSTMPGSDIEGGPAREAVAGPLPLARRAPAAEAEEDPPEPTVDVQRAGLAAPIGEPAPRGDSAPAARPRMPVAPVEHVLTQRAKEQAPSAAPAKLVGRRPLQLAVQRAPIAPQPDSEHAAAAGERDAPAAAGTSADRVPIHRGPEAADLASALDARAFTHRGEIYLPDSHGPLSEPPARALLAHELTHVAQQRTYGGNLPAEDTAAGQQLETHARAAEASGQPMLPVIHGRSTRRTQAAGLGAPLQGSPASSVPAPPAAQSTAHSRLAADARGSLIDALEPPSRGFPQPQRAAEDAGTPPATAATPTPTAAGKRSEEELEELARQLYGRIGLRLRHDLLAERERVGLAVDL